MSHFEDFDKRKAVAAQAAAVAAEERRLKEALWKLNQVIVPGMPEAREQQIRKIRDEVFNLGVMLYGWTD